MGASNFWDNQEKAQAVIAQMKPLNGVLKPFEEMQGQMADLEVLAEMAEEDASLEEELEGTLAKLEKKMEDFEAEDRLFLAMIGGVGFAVSDPVREAR